MGSLLIVCAGILWGFMGVFVNLLKSFGFTAIQCTTLRIFFAALVFVLISLHKNKSVFKIHICDLPLLAVTGMISISAMSLMYIASIDMTSLSVAGVLLYTSPIFVMIMSVLFLRQRLTPLKILSVICAFAGCYFVAGGGNKTVSAMGIIMGIGAGVSYASYSIFGTFALKKYSPLTVTTYAFVIGGIMMLFIGDTKGIILNFITMEKPYNAIFAAIFTGLITAVAPFLLYTKGLKTVSADKAAVIACIEPLTASLLGAVLYNENLNYTGIFLIIFAIVILQIKKKNNLV